MWSADVIGSIAALLVITFFWTAPAARGDVEGSSEIRSADARVARAAIERSAWPIEPKTIEKRVNALIPDAAHNCLAIANHTKSDVADRSGSPTQSALAAAVRQIRLSETGAWLVKVASSRRVTVCLDHATTLEAHYRSHLRLIGLSARLNPASRVVFLAHELAHVPQHPRFSNNRRFSPRDMLLLQRVREAAAEAVATRVLWQLRQQGFVAPWQEKLTTAYYDIAKRFETTMADGEGPARELWATRSAFHRWFEADWRRQIYDDLMLKTLARIAEDPVGMIPTSRHLSDRYLRGIGEYDGQGFLIGGDGSALISAFRTERLRPAHQARLDAILAEKHVEISEDLTSLDTATLSAVSPREQSESGDIRKDRR